MSKITKFEESNPFELNIDFYDEDLIEVKQAISKTLEKVFASVFNYENLQVFFFHNSKDPLNFCVTPDYENIKVDFNLEKEILYAIEMFDDDKEYMNSFIKRLKEVIEKIENIKIEKGLA